ncbi:redoxin domain-containing protein [Pedobacter sp. FW305-3-2-15-E-R2A2]|uniref:TlpA family protein disulfide reductase n=1 Tax=Pedobacter sp. FW305-3-2-15-E-R2A2 TaxID=3140251 RepID=UPI003140C5E2
MNKLMICIAMAMHCLFFKAEAQTADTLKYSIKPLKIGDQIPEALWNMPLKVVNHPEGKETVTLNDYRGKLIILDFWATWCFSCVVTMPKLHHVAQQFKDKIIILPIAYEEKNKIGSFIKTNQTLSPLNLSSVYADNLLRKTFPHRILPHCTWISADGRVITESLSDEVTVKNVQLALDNNPSSISKKIDLDPKIPVLLRNDLLSNLDLKSYGILFKGYYDGLGSGKDDLKTKKGVLTGKTISNLPLIEIYTHAISYLMPSHEDAYDPKRLVIKVKDKSKLIRDYGQPDSLFPKSNFYTYSMVIPPNKINKFYSYMLDDLNRCSGYYGKIEKRKAKCLILKRTSRKDKISTKGGKPFNTLFSNPRSRLQNLSLSSLAACINALDIIKVPVLNETGYTAKIDIDLSGNPDFPTLKKELRTFDLELIEAVREIDFFVITDQ